MLFLGSWLSGYFIIATNAWMQHPVAYSVAEDGRLFVNSLTGLLTNPWIFWQYAHNMTAAVVTGVIRHGRHRRVLFLSGQHVTHAKTFVTDRRGGRRHRVRAPHFSDRRWQCQASVQASAHKGRGV